ncbi:response regulator transcription factor [Steroidobacter sp. S1-65]|uniref:Response regulator transcription factor n=1 Tax=Steroidobacter gossypii TaxID=2805490 RepID=A0ABS1WU24_9GAMM|nr:response regulator transcription factor [Steroidobacter gossypii]MBM0104453.1 response regulator transcription factor [Steroidobacter gossypii]
MARVLIIEDDRVTADEIGAELQRYGLETEWVGDGNTGLERARGGFYDAITLDRMLPGMDGLTLVTRLRESGVQTPVLMISALSDADERVRGLRAGGDDYLTKPFNPDEMAARIEVLLRRHANASRPMVLRVGDLELDLIDRTARRGGTLLDLLPTEFRLLEFLMRHSGRVLTRTMIFEAVWGYHFDPGTNVIEVHIGRLRRKLDPPEREPLIHTVRGAGYVLEAR